MSIQARLRASCFVLALGLVVGSASAAFAGTDSYSAVALQSAARYSTFEGVGAVSPPPTEEYYTDPSAAIAAALAEAAAPSSFDGLTFYTSRAAFNAANPGLPVEDFEGAPGGVTNCGPVIDASGNGCYPPGEILDHLRLEGIPVVYNGDLVSVGPGVIGNPNNMVGPDAFDDDLSITFPGHSGGGVQAVGFDLAGLNQANATIAIFGQSGLLGQTNATILPGSGSFWGVSSDSEVITRIEVTGSVDLYNDLAFGGAGAPPAGCNVDIDVDFEGNLATLNLVLGPTDTQTRLTTWLVLSGQAFPLISSVPLPVLPSSYPIPTIAFSLPVEGNFGGLITLHTDSDGVACSDWDTSAQ